MEEIGKILRQARLEQKKSLADISKETKIQESLLLALERGEASAFAGEVYYRGALRNYAEALGLNYQDLKSALAQREKNDIMPPEGKLKNDKSNDHTRMPVSQAKRPLLSFSALVWIVLFLVVAGGGFWYLRQRDKSPVDALPDNETPQGMETSTPPEIHPPDNNEEKTEREEVEKVELLVLQEEGQKLILAVTGAEQLSLELQFRERCWIRLHKDDELIEEKNYLPGDQVNLQAEESLELLLGFPKGAVIKVNGLLVPGLDDKTSPYTVRLVKENSI